MGKPLLALFDLRNAASPECADSVCLVSAQLFW
jgi:hypothetical protein